MPLFKKLNILTVPDQLTLEELKFIHKVIHDQSPIPVRYILVDKQHPINPRTLVPIVFKSKISILKKSFLCNSIDLWRTASIESRQIKKLMPSQDVTKIY